MNHGPAAVHRITVGLIGVMLLVVGAGAIAWRAGAEPIVGWIDRVDGDAIVRFADGPWWPVVLVAIVVVALVWGTRLVTASIAPGSVDDLILDGSGADGALTVPPKLIAGAVAEDLKGHTMFDRVAVKALDDRNRKIIRLTVTTRPTRSYAEIAKVVGDATDAVRTAVDGSDIHVQALVHLENPKR
ncbi:hypothetical protein AAFP35_11275 [Gordonia sp. CPCC 206044]|uniref:hypothetical protein n=1 Tax=Gordonia sp. CPCC 206044 TaxID=3140793 RepID=UPI003AF3B3AF